MDDLISGAIFFCLRRDAAVGEIGGFAADGGAGGGNFSVRQTEDGVFADELVGFPDRDCLATEVDEQAEIERHDDDFFAGLDAFEFGHAVEVHDEVERGFVLGGDAEEGVPAFDDVDELAVHVGGGKDLVEIHVTDDAAGGGGGWGSGKCFCDGAELLAGFCCVAESEEFVGFLKCLFAGVDVWQFGRVELFDEFFVGLLLVRRDDFAGDDFFKDTAHG